MAAVLSRVHLRRRLAVACMSFPGRLYSTLIGFTFAYALFFVARTDPGQPITLALNDTTNVTRLIELLSEDVTW